MVNSYMWPDKVTQLLTKILLSKQKFPFYFEYHAMSHVFIYNSLLIHCVMRLVSFIERD